MPPSHVSRLHAAVAGSPGAVLLVLPTSTPATLEAARDLGWSVITYADSPLSGSNGFLRIGGTEVALGRTLPQAGTGSPARRGPKAWGASRVTRLLLEGGLWTQSTLSRRAEVSQPLVSLELNKLLDDALVTRTKRLRTTLWTAADWDGLLDRWVRTYPGPGGMTTYWFGFGDVVKQVDAAVTALDVPERASLSPVTPPMTSWLRGDDPSGASSTPPPLTSTGCSEAG